MPDERREGFTYDEAVEGLRRGDFSRLAPLFGDPATPERVQCAIAAWFDAGAFAHDGDALAEALTCACWLGRTALAEHLMDHGVDAAAGTATGLDALHWAANRGQLGAVRLLLARGVSTETVSMHGGTVIETAIWSAINEPRGEQLAIIDALLAHGARPVTMEVPTGHADVDALLRWYG